MCEFISWIEHNGKLYYLTKKQLDSKKGKQLAEYCGRTEDLVGHGAIREYYGFSGGLDRECTDFSIPDNFPDEIVSALKRGLFCGMGIPLEILTLEAQKEYLKIEQSAYKEYQRIKQSAYEEYSKIEQSAYEEYSKIEQSAYEKYSKIKQSAYKEYQRIIQSAYEEYSKIKQSAYEEYSKIIHSTEEEYLRIVQSAFWKLFKDPNNRRECWK